MNWVPADWDVLTLASVIVAVLAALVAIAAGVNELTATARRRSTLAWLNDAIDVEGQERRRKVLIGMRIGIHARMVAGKRVPWWLFSEAACYMVLLPIVIVGFADGKVTTGFPWGVLAAGVGALLVFRRMIRVYCERVRIADHYAWSKKPLAPARLDLVAQMEGGHAQEFAHAALLTAGLAAVTLGASAAFADEKDSWASALLVLGIVTMVQTVNVIRSYASKTAKAAR